MSITHAKHVTDPDMPGYDVLFSDWNAAHSVSALPVLVTFPFAYNTASIATGAAVYTPTVGDRLVGAWIEVTTAWDQTLRADIGGFAGGGAGLFYQTGNGSVGLTGADVPSTNGASMALLATPGNFAYQPRFLTTDPLLLVVNDTGTYGGTVAVAPTQGAATLCLLIVKA